MNNIEVGILTSNSDLRPERSPPLFENGGLAVRGAVVAVVTFGNATGAILLPDLSSCATPKNLDSPAKNPDAGLAIAPACSCPLHRCTAEGTHVGINAVRAAMATAATQTLQPQLRQKGREIGDQSLIPRNTSTHQIHEFTKFTKSTHNDTELEQSVATVANGKAH